MTKNLSLTLSLTLKMFFTNRERAVQIHSLIKRQFLSPLEFTAVKQLLLFSCKVCSICLQNMANKLKFCSKSSFSKLSHFWTPMVLKEVIGAMTHKVWTWIAFTQSPTPFVIPRFTRRKLQFCMNTVSKDFISTQIYTVMPLNAAALFSETQSRTKRSKFVKSCFQNCSVWIV